jgi:hypothetical protein
VYEELTRTMNRQERSLLTELVANTEPPLTLAGTVKWVFVWTGGIVLCALAATALISLGVNPVIGGIIGGPLAIAVILFIYIILILIGQYHRVSRSHREFMQHEAPQIQKALENGSVFVKRVSANAVIEIVEFEDEGSGYIYDVGDGKTLFLKGQRFFPVDEDMRWPNSEFEIVRTVHGDVWVGIFCSGNELTPVRVLETSECIDDIVWAEREEMLDGDIDHFAKSIKKAS